MYYWNRDNFEGLLDLASALQNADPDFRLLAEYCRSRENGLRRRAFDALQQFLDISKSWNDYEARSRCQSILDLQSLVPGVHQFLSQPLVTQFIEPILESWLVDEPDNPQPLRWLGLLRSNSDYLFKVLAITPGDEPVRSRLVTMHIDEVDYATHHLDEGHFIGELEEARHALKTAQELLEDASSSFPREELAEELQTYESMLNDWEQYSGSPDGTFPEWCAAKNRTYFWPTKIYYDKG